MEKIFNVSYLIIVALFFTNLFIAYPINFLSDFDKILVFMPFVLLMILLVAYKKTYKNEITENSDNKFCKNLAQFAFILVILSTLTLLIISIIFNNELINYTQDSYFFTLINYTSLVVRDIITKIFFPVIAFLFFINYRKNKNIGARYYNLKYFVLTSLLLLIVTLFSKFFALFFYDLGLFILHKLGIIN